VRKLVGLSAITLAAVVLAGSVARAEPHAPAVQWGGRQFSSPTSLTAWLEARGLSYDRWAANHPGAAARLEARGGGEVLGGSRRSDHAREEPITLTPVKLAPESASTAAAILLGALAAVSTALLALAVLPSLARWRLPEVLARSQPELAGAGIAVALAAGIAYLL
jgi:hypothetical protein